MKLIEFREKLKLAWISHQEEISLFVAEDRGGEKVKEVFNA
jgi:hypothetical protein